MVRPAIALALFLCPVVVRGEARNPASPCNGRAYVAALSAADWDAALAEAERCRLSPPSLGSGIYWQEVSAAFYTIYVAQLTALSGRTDRAETTVPWNITDLTAFGVPIDKMVAVTEAFNLERSGANDAALQKYESVGGDFGSAGRAALLAFKGSDDAEAGLWGHIGDLIGDPTAQYVLGALAETHGHASEAGYYYVQALLSLEKYGRGNPSSPLYFVEQARIRSAADRYPGGETTYVKEVDGLATYVDDRGRELARELQPGVLSVQSVRDRQHQYNTWVSSRPADTSGLIAWVPQYPRRLALSSVDIERNDPIERLRLPTRIDETGILDLDTVAIGYYHAAADWAQLCGTAGVTPADLSQALDASSRGRPEVGEHEVAVWLLATAYSDLRRLNALLSGIQMRTLDGRSLNAVEEAANAPPNISGDGKNVRSDASSGSYIPIDRLTDPFVEHLLTLERTARGRLFLTRSLLSSQN